MAVLNTQEERLALLDSTRAHAQGRQAERPDESDDIFAPRHRNYQNLSSRSPDDFDVNLDEGDEGDGRYMELNAAGGLQGGSLVPGEREKAQDEEEKVAGIARGAAAVSGAVAESGAAFLGRTSPPSPAPLPSGNKVSIPGAHHIQTSPFQYQTLILREHRKMYGFSASLRAAESHANSIVLPTWEC